MYGLFLRVHAAGCAACDESRFTLTSLIRLMRKEIALGALMHIRLTSLLAQGLLGRLRSNLLLTTLIGFIIR